MTESELLLEINKYICLFQEVFRNYNTNIESSPFICRKTHLENMYSILLLFYSEIIDSSECAVYFIF